MYQRPLHPLLTLALCLTLWLPLHATPTPPSKPEVIQRGIDFLLLTQNPDGSWGNATKTKGMNIYAPLPGAHHAFRIASSSLALSGILAHTSKETASPPLRSAIDKAEAYFFENLPHLRRADLTTTYNVWGHAYALRTLCALHRHHPDDPAHQAKIKALAQGEIDKLTLYEDVNGGWGYLDFDAHTRKPSGHTTSFMTATVLLAARDARDTLGLDLSEKITQRALHAIREQRNPDLTYAYSRGHRIRPRHRINRPAGSLARSQACNAALFAHQDPRVTSEKINEWLTRFDKRHGWLDIARKKPIPHESHFAVSGYFYYYGIFYARECINYLPLDEQAPHQAFLDKTLAQRQEKDGSWWDYPLYNYHQPYGTGYALLALAPKRP